MAVPTTTREPPQPGVLPVKQTKRQTRTFYNRIARFYDQAVAVESMWVPVEIVLGRKPDALTQE